MALSKLIELKSIEANGVKIIYVYFRNTLMAEHNNEPDPMKRRRIEKKHTQKKIKQNVECETKMKN